MRSELVKTLAICDTQPIVIEGVRSLLSSCEDLEMVGGVSSLLCGMEMVREQKPSVVVIDKAFGLNAVLDWVANITSMGLPTAPVIWGLTMSEAEALRMVKAGAMGVIHKTAELNDMLDCFHAVSLGQSWMEESLLHEAERAARPGRSNLTTREQQVVELVEQGLKNKEIASALGIRPGTVKIHLKHIFEKTGVRGRYGLALTGLREKGLLAMSHTN